MARDTRTQVAENPASGNATPTVAPTKRPRKKVRHTLVKIIKPFMQEFKAENDRTATYRDIENRFPELFPRFRMTNPRRGSENVGKWKKGDPLPDNVSSARGWFYSLQNSAKLTAEEKEIARKLREKLDEASGLGVAEIEDIDVAAEFGDMDDM